jgi:hypothetical protein
MAVNLVALMEKISAADEIALYDERGADYPMSDEEIDAILRALVEMLRKQDAAAND